MNNEDERNRLFNLLDEEQPQALEDNFSFQVNSEVFSGHNELEKSLSHAGIVEVPNQNPNSAPTLKFKNSTAKIPDLIFFIGNIPSASTANDIIQIISANWTGLKGKPGKHDFVNIVNFKADSLDRNCLNTLIKRYNYLHVKIAATNQQRDLGSVSFGIHLAVDRAEIINAIEKITIDNPDLELPLGLSVGISKTKENKFGTLTWLGLKNFFKFINRTGGNIQIGDDTLTSSTIHFNIRWEDLTSCSNLVQVYNFDNYTDAGDLANTLNDLGLTEAEYLIKTGSRANIDYGIILTPLEKQKSIVTSLQKNFPLMAAALVTPTRKLQEKPIVQTKRKETTTINPDLSTTIMSLTKKVDTLTTLVKLLDSEIRELKKKDAKQGQGEREQEEEDMEMSESSTNSEDRQTNRRTPNTENSPIEISETQNPKQTINTQNSENHNLEEQSSTIGISPTPSTPNTMAYNTRSKTKERKEEVRDSEEKTLKKAKI